MIKAANSFSGYPKTLDFAIKSGSHQGWFQTFIKGGGCNRGKGGLKCMEATFRGRGRRVGLTIKWRVGVPLPLFWNHPWSDNFFSIMKSELCTINASSFLFYKLNFTFIKLKVWLFQRRVVASNMQKFVFHIIMTKSLENNVLFSIELSIFSHF